MYITHRFVPGLRFDTPWKYASRTRSGRPHWEQLPLEQADASKADPHGAWWCARRCATVLQRQSWKSLHLPSERPARPEPVEVAHTLASVMPGWQVSFDTDIHDAALLPCTDALLAGGGALLQLRPTSEGGGRRSSFWAWVVGIELQDRVRAPSPRTPRPAHPQSLLTLPFGWALPQACGYSARVRPRPDALCTVDGVEGQSRDCHCLGAVILTPGPGHAQGFQAFAQGAEWFAEEQAHPFMGMGRNAAALPVRWPLAQADAEEPDAP